MNAVADTLMKIFGFRREKIKIHPKLKPFHESGNCACFERDDDCGNWVACGPGHTCFHDKSDLIGMIPQEPCEYCGFWAGTGMKDWEIENAATILGIMAYSRKERE